MRILDLAFSSTASQWNAQTRESTTKQLVSKPHFPIAKHSKQGGWEHMMWLIFIAFLLLLPYHISQVVPQYMSATMSFFPLAVHASPRVEGGYEPEEEREKPSH